MKIGAVMLYVDDSDTALELYRNTVGLDVADIDPGAGYQPLVDFACLTSDRAALEILDRATHGSGITDDEAGRVHIGLAVADLATERARLNAIGATETRDRGTYFVLSAPEGNRLQAYQFEG
ncbi:MAG: VOC family protein [bacterium]|nr:VOC family protein [bacterium]